MKLYLSFLLFILPFCATAQSDVVDPAVEFYRQQLSDKVIGQMNKIDWGRAEKKATAGTIKYTIPVVVHVLQDYSNFVSDNAIFDFIARINSVFLKTSPDTIDIIEKYKSVAANTEIGLKLATIAPDGKQTKGIDRISSYLTNFGYLEHNQAKIRQWPQDKYLNIWIVNSGYTGNNSATPFQAAYYPYYDGVMYYYALSASTRPVGTIAKYLNLPEACPSNSPPCFDGDGIPDTPPCYRDHEFDCGGLSDTVCNVPNRQNVMYSDYEKCAVMFTNGQAKYMQYILQIDIGKRDSLVTESNYHATGMDRDMPDMLPVADFSVKNFAGKPTYFFCQGQPVYFKNESWNDTIIAASWSFLNKADTPSSTSLTSVGNKFHQPGWCSVLLDVTGNNTGTTSLRRGALYIADTIPVNAKGYYQDFTPRGDAGKWPTFNYYNNEFKWQPADVGFGDNYSLSYTSYDGRSYPGKYTGTPHGDYDDLFSPAFDLAGFGGDVYLNFMTSGATTALTTNDMKDSLTVEYSIDKGNNWTKAYILKGAKLANKGTVAEAYKPTGNGDWLARSVKLPAAAKGKQTFFRFRYCPGADPSGFSTGNNFYIDRIHFNDQPEDVSIPATEGKGVLIYPNPAKGSVTVMMHDDRYIHKATITVTDIAGRTICKVTNEINSTTGKVCLPADTFGTKGIYFVHIMTDGINRVEKLVIE